MWLLEPLILPYAFVLGALWGSFLNVCIARWPEEKSVIFPSSRCPKCETEIAWRDNVPILGYLLLRGRCRSCQAVISPQYPLVELGTGLLWLYAASRLGLSMETLSASVFFTILLGIALTDAKTYIIPDEFSIGGLVLGLLLSLAPGGITLGASLKGAALGFGLMYGIAVVGEWLAKKPAMGGGDIKMMAMVGAFIGPLGVPLTLFAGSLLGTLLYVPFAWKQRRLVPFGVFLAGGAFLVHEWGDALLQWYFDLILGGTGGVAL